MDQHAVRLALGLTIAGASMLTVGVAAWAIGALGRVTSGLAAHDLRVLALALLAGGVVCGLGMGFGLAAAARADRQTVPAAAAGPAAEAAGSVRTVPSLADPRTLMNPPPPSPPPLAPPRPPGTLLSGQPLSGAPSSGAPLSRAPSSGDRGHATRVWWRAAHGPAGQWDDGNSEEWLRSLRGPAIQQPPPHSAE
jgi:hypothetical protein